jgi:hypothetical protein
MQIAQSEIYNLDKAEFFGNCQTKSENLADFVFIAAM